MTFPKYLSESELLVATLFKKQHISEGYSESEFHAPYPFLLTNSVSIVANPAILPL